ncbi:hypothetical protein PROFUN_07594 [Planoprotostelium fungivorum]|uniref:6-phosphogluconolactonase n=1 Tax=Planoprotostelium fungivorum TaxID=1890364 RepID=A0A2P6NLU4_9EUKA|nr:hypothetical protein PROFUN_07594 [Planoprotostelium fungivorum]
MKSVAALLLLCIQCINIVCSRTVYVASSNTGIWMYNQNEDGSLQYLSNPVRAATNFLAAHPNGKYLYATSTDNNTYTAYQVRGASLTKLNDVPSSDNKGSGVAHVSIHPSGKMMFGANYDEGSFVSFNITDDGYLQQRIFFNVPGTGSKGNWNRQQGPHAHMITTTPNHKYVVGLDLGADRIWMWKYDPSSLTPSAPNQFIAPLGSGPRHIAFSPKGQYAYVVTELGCTVMVFNYAEGVLQLVQTISTVPSGTNGVLAGEIRVHPSGNFVYVSNRWSNTNNIAVFSVDPNNGNLRIVNWMASGGTSPRGLNLCPSGKYLYAANEYADGNGNSLFVFRIDQNSGTLTLTNSYPNGGGCLDVEFSPETIHDFIINESNNIIIDIIESSDHIVNDIIAADHIFHPLHIEIHDDLIFVELFASVCAGRCQGESCCPTPSGPQCYQPSVYSCSADDLGKYQLCPKGLSSCGSACYSTSQYKCKNGFLTV